jgi:putative membrane protein
MLALGLGMIGYRLCIEWLSYRQLQIVDRTRAALSGRDGSIETVRAAALGWLGQIDTLAGVDDVVRAIRAAPTLIELQAILSNRAADPLREAANGIGLRAALQGASLIAISPHASWDGLIAGVRAILLIRAIARLFGLRPGPTVTIALVRKVVWTAAGTAAIELMSQNLADHLMSSMPGVKHLAAVVPGSSVAALRLYRLAGIAAEACCPVVK